MATKTGEGKLVTRTTCKKLQNRNFKLKNFYFFIQDSS
jgi:hypothetical protein